MKILFYLLVSGVLLGVQAPKNVTMNGTYNVSYNFFKTERETVEVANIEISRPITLAQYKRFLETKGKDEQANFQPDFRVLKSKYSSEYSFPTIKWNNYFHSGKFDNYPVLGVTWENAMNYCEWLNKNSNGDYEYRLPIPKELLVYFQHFEKKQILTHRSEWTINAYNESFGSILEPFRYDAIETDSPASKRKTIVYTEKTNTFIRYNYQNCSDEFTSFRIVKALKNTSNENTLFRTPISF